LKDVDLFFFDVDKDVNGQGELVNKADISANVMLESA